MRQKGAAKLHLALHVDTEQRVALQQINVLKQRHERLPGVENQHVWRKGRRHRRERFHCFAVAKIALHGAQPVGVLRAQTGEGFRMDAALGKDGVALG